MQRLWMCHFLFVFVVVGLGWAAPSPAVDLTTIDRIIQREPKYQTKMPKYALLVFGQEAKTRVWLVLDGDTLYVDRNGNGDLTEPHEIVKGEGKNGRYTFQAGEVQDGERTHVELNVDVGDLSALPESPNELPDVWEVLRRQPQSKSYSVALDVSMPGFKGAGNDGRIPQAAFGFDNNGILQFANHPQDAPVLHFGGSWVVTTFGPQTIELDRENDFVLVLGTRGLGPGTFAYSWYEGLVPDELAPVLKIEFPAKSPGLEPVEARYSLPRRC